MLDRQVYQPNQSNPKEQSDVALNNANIVDQLLGRVELRAYLFDGDRSDVALRQVPSHAGDKNLGKEGGDAPRVVVLIREINYNDPGWTYIYPRVDTSSISGMTQVS
jgi:hypothetical protein